MFNINYIQLFKSIPPQIATMIIAMLPIAELRVSIPVALAGYKLSLASAFFWSVLGNIIPALIILKYIGPISEWLRKKSAGFNKFFTWWFKRTESKFHDSFLKYGSVALIIFVAIPLPMTGAWSGALAAFLFNIPPQKAFWLITSGVILTGIIITIATKLGIFGFGMMR
ncbi:MAG: small multi-drug export protein [bacterium]